MIFRTHKKRFSIVIILLVIVFGVIFFLRRLPQPESKAPISIVETNGTVENAPSSGVYNRAMEAWPNRSYRYFLPDLKKAEMPPVLMVLHGSGIGGAESMQRLTCPTGTYGEAGCLDTLAAIEKFITVYPNGTSSPNQPDFRTWNAGGGENGFTCLTGYACEKNIDDVRYISDVLDDLASLIQYDKKRVYVAGFSNGAALAHKLACELDDRIAAIAPVANGNQHSTTEPCEPKHSMPVIEIHSVDDPFNPYAGGEKRTFGSSGMTISIEETVLDWSKRNACENEGGFEPVSGTTVEVKNFSKCRNNASIVLYKLHDGGHTWPGGWQYLNQLLVGKTERSISANELIWNFVSQYRR